MINILYISIITFFHVFHPIYLSVTEIEHDAESQALEITMRYFIDDLELSIRNDVGEPTMDITAPGDSYTTNQLLENYLRKHFKVSVNGEALDYKYLGHEVELPVMYIYVLVPEVKNIEEISIFNDFITETYEDQANLVHVKVNDEMKSLKLTKSRKQDKLEF